MLASLPNSELLLAPLRQNEAVISSRMEGTISTVDEVMIYEADTDEAAALYSEYWWQRKKDCFFEKILFALQHWSDGKAVRSNG